MSEDNEDCTPSKWARLSVTAHLPSGYAAWGGFRAIGAVFYRYWGGLCRAYDDLTDTQCRMERELNPYTTRDMLPEWEASFNLPDPCLPYNASFEARKAAMLARFEGKRVVDLEQWRALAAQIGVTATITAGDEIKCDQGFPYKFPIVFGGQTLGGRYLIYIDAKECQNQKGFPYQFPIIFGETGEKCKNFKCKIKEITPSFVTVIWGKPPNM